jgi:hypothetical protein
MQLANKPIPFVDGRTTISHAEQHPADTENISALNGIDPDKMLPFYTKASSRERMENLYPSSLYLFIISKNKPDFYPKLKPPLLQRIGSSG